MSRLFALTKFALALSIPITTLATPIQPAEVNETGRLQSSDLYRLRSVGTVALSPDEARVAYTVVNRDRPGRPDSQVWVMELATRKTQRLGGEKESTSDPVWSPDGKWLAFQGGDGDNSGLIVAHPDGTGRTLLAPIKGTNSPLPGQGESVTWSPDSKQIAFVSSTAGTGDRRKPTGDPMVITRYLYKPTAGEGLTHFNDNRRLHIFIVDVATKQVAAAHRRHTTTSTPSTGRRMGRRSCSFPTVSRTQDEFFNYDLFALQCRRRRTFGA